MSRQKTSPPRHPRSGQSPTTAFTLIEVAIAIAITSTVVLAVVALIPLGSRAASDSTNATITGLILEDAHLQLEGLDLAAQTVTPRFYDGQGIFVGAVTPDPGTGLNFSVDPRYRADIRIVEPAILPDHLGDSLRQAIVEIYWPINSATGAPLGSGAPKKTVSYHVTTMAARNWEEVDPSFTPKIEF